VALTAVAAGSWLWVAALFIAPAAVDSPHHVVSLAAATVYAAGSNACHQRPERSFHLAGRKMPVCARCTGLYVSAAAAAPFALLFATTLTARRARILLLVAAIPTAATWLLEFTGVMPFSNAARAAAALPLGFAAGWLVLSTLSRRSAPRTPLTRVE
jgi:uncharacterized membrane protein